MSDTPSSPEFVTVYIVLKISHDCESYGWAESGEIEAFTEEKKAYEYCTYANRVADPKYWKYTVVEKVAR